VCATFFVLIGGGERQWKEVCKFVDMMTQKEDQAKCTYKTMSEQKYVREGVLDMLINSFEDLWCRIVVSHR
jgi:hypothetical protein